eukprot:Clim_evm63s144 gene=Clim_evmTU63s144
MGCNLGKSSDRAESRQRAGGQGGENAAQGTPQSVPAAAPQNSATVAGSGQENGGGPLQSNSQQYSHSYTDRYQAEQAFFRQIIQKAADTMIDTTATVGALEGNEAMARADEYFKRLLKVDSWPEEVHSFVSAPAKGSVADRLKAPETVDNELLDKLRPNIEDILSAAASFEVQPQTFVVKFQPVDALKGA